VLRNRLVKPGDAVHALGQPRGGQLPAGRVLDLNVVVVFGLVITDQQQRTLLVRYFPLVQPAEDTARGLTDPLLTPLSGGHATPSTVWPSGRPAGARSDLRSHVLQAIEVLTRRRLRHRVSTTRHVPLGVGALAVVRALLLPAAPLVASLGHGNFSPLFELFMIWSV
jgi:hypothetical protein